MCDNDHSWTDHFNFDTADVICRKLNFTRAVTWNTEESFDIQINYPIYLRKVRCNYNAYYNGDWCGTFSYTAIKYYGYVRTRCSHNHDLFLSCTGKSAEEFCFYLSC